jgi:hypothetical protein
MKTIAMTLVTLGFIAVALTLPGQTEAGGSIGLQVAARGSEASGLEGIIPTGDRRFIEGESGIIIDTHTGLEWFAGSDKDTTWDEANNWVKSLSIDGSGWRMPERNEVKSLYIKANGEPNTSCLFQDTSWFVWTSETESSLVNSYAWGFSFYSGYELRPLCSSSDYARGFAVRSAKRRRSNL